jgi:hypothetical protein
MEIKVVNDRREFRPLFVTFEVMWLPIVHAGKDRSNSLLDLLLTTDVRARYFNQETNQKEEVDLIEILDIRSHVHLERKECDPDCLYARIRRSNGKHLYVQCSLICKPDDRGRPVPDYIF